MNTTPRKSGYEQRDISVVGVVIFAVTLILALVLVHFLALGTFRHLSRESSTNSLPPLASTREPFTGPRLLVDQKQDMEIFRVSEDAALSSYSWVDRAHGVVRIPIDRSMELLAQRGTLP